MSVAATKKKAPNRADRLEARVTPEAKALFQKAAEMQGQTLTDFVVSSVLDAARQVLQEHEFARLTYRDRLTFAEALLNPAEPTARLRQAMAQHSTIAEN